LKMNLVSDDVLRNIGIASLFLVLIFISLLVLVLITIYIISEKKNVIDKLSSGILSIILKVLLFILDIMYVPSKRLVSFVGGNENAIDIVCTDIRNVLLRREFMKVPYKDRIVILPQCLRDLSCKTTFSSIEGSRCLGCGRCKIFDIVTKAKGLGYKDSYIAPGGGFVRRIIKKVKPGAVVGIGCSYEVNMGLIEVSSKGIPVQGVILLKGGCVETDVDLEEVFHTLKLKTENGK